jgi:hypothetical protein
MAIPFGNPNSCKCKIKWFETHASKAPDCYKLFHFAIHFCVGPTISRLHCNVTAMAIFILTL